MEEQGLFYYETQPTTFQLDKAEALYTVTSLLLSFQQVNMAKVHEVARLLKNCADKATTEEEREKWLLRCRVLRSLEKGGPTVTYQN